MKTLMIKILFLGFVLFVACSKEESLTPTTDDQKLEQLGKEIQEFAKNKARLAVVQRVILFTHFQKRMKNN
jgi:hypothetical protein